MPHPIFGVDELLRLVINELVEISEESAVSFAVTCRSFEEPTLSSLWKKQSSLFPLLGVLPGCIWDEDEYGFRTVVSGRHSPTAYRTSYQSPPPQEIEHDPSAKDWARLRQYASWMRELELSADGTPDPDILFQLSHNSPGGLLFPRLELLYWDIIDGDMTFPFFRLFLSPRLRRVTLYADDGPSEIPREEFAPLIQFISALPTSLEALYVSCDQEEEPLTDAISSFVCRRGLSLRSFGSRLPLLEAAVHHLTQLPNLSYWNIAQGPPRVLSASILPSLKQLHLDKQEALPWLYLLASHQDSVLSKCSASVTSHTNIRETLTSLECPKNITVDSTFLSSIVKFRNLATLRVNTILCHGAGGCFFRITDAEVKDLATALPRLKSLHLGPPCRSNICDATVASLMSISTHCLDLICLDTHFNTQTIVADMQRLLDGGAERDKAKCKLWSYSAGFAPLQVQGQDIQTVEMGFKAIFPNLTTLRGFDRSWGEMGIGVNAARIFL